MSKIYSTTSAKIEDWEKSTDYGWPPDPFPPKMYYYDGKFLYWKDLPQELKNEEKCIVSPDSWKLVNTTYGDGYLFWTWERESV